MGKLLGITLIAITLCVVFAKEDGDEKEMSTADMKKKVFGFLKLDDDATAKDMCAAYEKMGKGKGKEGKERKRRESDDDDDKKGGKKGRGGGMFKEIKEAVAKVCKESDVTVDKILETLKPFFKKFGKGKGGKGKKGKKDDDDK